MARQVDFYGTSFYPKHSAFVDRDVPWRAALLDFTRSFGYDEGRRGFWVGELQGGFGTIALNVSPTVTPEDLRIWTWSALVARRQGHQLLRLVSDELRLRVGRVRAESSSTARSRSARSWRARSRASSIGIRRCSSTRGPRAPRSRSSTTRWRISSAAVSAPRRTAARREKSSASSAIRCSASIARCFRRTSRSTTCTSTICRRRAASVQTARHPALSADAATGVRRGDSRVRAATAVRSWPKRGSAGTTSGATRRIAVPGLGLSEVMGARESSDRDGPERPHVDRAGAAAIFQVSTKGDQLPGRWYKETLEPTSPSRPHRRRSSRTEARRR